MKLGIVNTLVSKTAVNKTLFSKTRAVVVGALLLAAGAASGEAPPPAPLAPQAMAGSTAQASATLEKIRRNGAIYLAYQEAALPFSYLDASGDVHGYTWELCLRVVEAVRARLQRTDLAVVPVLTGASTRLMAVEAGTADLACGPVVNTEQRARSVAFSHTYFVAGFKPLVRKDAGIRTLADLKGKAVVALAGSGAEAAVKATAGRRNLMITVRTVRNAADAVDEVLAGRAAAFVQDDVLAHARLADAGEAARLAVVNENFGVEPYGLMFRKGDGEFKKLVDETLVGLMRSGEFERLYARWFLSPIPPQGANLQLPMSAELKQLMQTPNDRGI